MPNYSWISGALVGVVIVAVVVLYFVYGTTPETESVVKPAETDGS